MKVSELAVLLLKEICNIATGNKAVLYTKLS
jgi:hypothetical protein